MCFSRSNVKKLVIKPTSRPVRWQLHYCVQTVSTAAPYKNRMFFIFKIQACLVPVSGVCVQYKLPPCKYAQFLLEQIVHISKLIKKCIFLCLYLLNYIILCMFCLFLFMDIFFVKLYDDFKVIQGRNIMTRRRNYIDCVLQ